MSFIDTLKEQAFVSLILSIVILFLILLVYTVIICFLLTLDLFQFKILYMDP